MTRLSLTLATGLLLGGLGLGSISASAAPAMPQAGVVAESTTDAVAYRRHYRHHHSTKAERMMRRRNTMRHGNSNARNPAMRGYQQNLGDTVGGPRY
ncbi:hypothetical protein FV219_21155 [Methylobacterium sp. WL122]|nr:hypothetical protein FV219_21155 [Methylobacterium sp. WL122]